MSELHVVQLTVDHTVDPPVHPPVPPPPYPGLEGRVGIGEASRVLGITREGVRQRIRRGQLDAVKVDGQWWVQLPVGPTSTPNNGDPSQSAVGHTSMPSTPPTEAAYKLVTAQLEAENAFLRQECERLHELVRAEQETRRREVSELHILLQRAQAAIPLPVSSAQPPAAQSDAAPSSSAEPVPKPRQQHRHWWQLWGFWRAAWRHEH